MPERLNRALRYAAAVSSLAVILLLIWLGWGQVTAAASLHRHWRLTWLIAAVAAQLLVYVAIGGIFKLSLPASPNKPSFLYLMYCGFAFLFANRAIPGPAVAGVATLVYLMQGKRVSAVDAQAAAGCFYVADYAGFITLIATISVPLLTAQRNDTVHAAYIAGLSIICVGVCFMISLFAWPGKAVSVAWKTISAIAYSGRRIVQPKWSRQEFEAVIYGLHGKMMSVFRTPAQFLPVFFLSALMHCSEVATVVFGAKAAGISVPPVAAAEAYVAGNLASIVSVLPGALGFYEAGMVGTLHVAGHLSVANAIVCAFAYRFLSIWAPLPAVFNVLLQVLGKLRVSARHPD